MCGVCNFDLIRSGKAKERDKKLLTFVLLHKYVNMKMNQKWIRSEGECEYDVNLQCSNVWKISDVLEPNLPL